ncbi:methyltransferase domain-containing protein [Amycolatopsis sp.]|uniref:methyltransferase domain-containing protein n=1 Tax=Amycolatopsis sp. TaxID=37632 RepID=UPI002C4BD273|nr:methyltransferase domain-containing protein [Amycolatopsis sp.]HVV13066.1 methyltransferase domain-containing protein [Amycolatopsis sp.]
MTTATTSCRGESSRARRAGTAGSGVPANTRRIKAPRRFQAGRTSSLSLWPAPFRQHAGAARAGDAHALPVPDRSVERARADRIVQHVTDPAAVFAEFHRVPRPGRVACVAEPDWDSIVVDPGGRAGTCGGNRRLAGMSAGPFLATSILFVAVLRRPDQIAPK